MVLSVLCLFLAHSSHMPTTVVGHLLVGQMSYIGAKESQVLDVLTSNMMIKIFMNGKLIDILDCLNGRPIAPICDQLMCTDIRTCNLIFNMNGLLKAISIKALCISHIFQAVIDFLLT